MVTLTAQIHSLHDSFLIRNLIFKLQLYLHGGCSTLYSKERIDNKYVRQPGPFSVTWRHRTRDIRFAI